MNILGFIRESYWNLKEFEEFEKQCKQPNAIFIPKRSAKIKAKGRNKKKKK